MAEGLAPSPCQRMGNYRQVFSGEIEGSEIASRGPNYQESFSGWEKKKSSLILLLQTAFGETQAVSVVRRRPRNSERVMSGLS